MKFKLTLTILSIFLIGRAHGNVTLPKIFTDNMVLQRDAPIHVWGWASPGETVKVVLNGKTVSVKTARNGKWLVKLPVMTAGGPYTLSVEGKNTITLTNVLIGDVWICSGQSNMQWAVNQTNFQLTDTSFIKNAPIRLFTVYVDTDYMPREDVRGSGWQTLSVDNINKFSAVAFHFGRYTEQQLHVPIGLISDNLGATSIETWMSNDALMQFPQFKKVIVADVARGKSFAQLTAEFEKMKPEWYKNYYYKGIGIDQEWYKPETNLADWKPIDASGNTWEQSPDLKDHDGEVWFRTTFDVPEADRGKDYHIPLSQIDDYDIAWVNGVKVGENYGRHNHHGYTVKADVLKPTGNVLVVRVFDVGGIGGFTTSPFWTGAVMKGTWIYKKGSAIDAEKFPKPVVPNATPFSSPSVLYNGSIAPLTKLSIKGAIWYQGEGNADRGYEYRQLFPAMIQDWRKQWAQGDFPFLFVQLANYHDESPNPVGSSWAELREAQAMALIVPNTGMATAIDIGEANDIHPKNKLEVGNRLGMAAMKVAYHKDVEYSGPTLKEFHIQDNKVIVSYDHAKDGLVCRDKYGYITGFQIAGDDRKFYWAKAKIDGNTVVVFGDKVDKPVAIRYAWDDNPGKLSLYNTAGLPAIPFRTDDWPGDTTGKVFQDGPRF